MKKFSKDVHFKKIVRPSFFLLFFVGFVMPIFIHAATFSDLVNKFVAYVNVIVYLLASLAILVFLWGVLKYMMAGDSKEKLTNGRDFIIYGIIGIFVMMSVWGLVNILIKTFGLETAKPTTLLI